MAICEVAAKLGVDTRTVRRLVRKGELSAYRIGGQLRFDPADLDKFLNAARIDAVRKPRIIHL